MYFMKKTLVLVVLATVASLVGCASPSGDEPAGSSEANFEGSPAGIVERDTAAKKQAEAEAQSKKDSVLRRALFTAYKADTDASHLSRLNPENTGICGSQFQVPEGTTMMYWSVSGMAELQTQLARNDVETDYVLIAERAAGATKTLDFIVVKKDTGTSSESLCFSRSRVEKLRCAGVSLTKGPSAEQCGIKG